MVRFVDLEEEAEEDVFLFDDQRPPAQRENGRPDPNYEHRLAVVLSCYP